MRLDESRTGQVCSGIAACENVLVNARGGDQLDASVIADSCVLQLDDLGNFLVRDAEAFELLNITRPHSRLVQRTVVRKGMLVTTYRQEDTHTEKHSLVPHTSILREAKRVAAKCVRVIPGQRYRRDALGSNFKLIVDDSNGRVWFSTGGIGKIWRREAANRKLNLVNAFDSEDAGNFSDIDEDGFKLAAVHNFQAGFDAGI